MKKKIIAIFITSIFLLSTFSAISIGTKTIYEKNNTIQNFTFTSDDEKWGLVVPEGWNDNEDKFNPISARSNLPDRFDWRELNGCPPIRDQGMCGSCWAFATVGVLECNIKIKEGKEVDLSEQWLVSCNTYVDSWGRHWGCDGGWYAHDYFMEEPVGEKYVDECGQTGAVLEKKFPYGSQEWADTGYVPNCECPYPHRYYIKDWKYIGSQNGNTIDQIKSAILNYGPIACAVYCDSNWGEYKGGVFDYDINAPNVNHAVVLVGWDDNQGTNGVWFLRNSWGPDWGEDKNGLPWDESPMGGGYMRIEYSTCNIGHSANYIVYEPEIHTIDLDFTMHKIKALDNIEQTEAEGEADWSYQISVLRDEEWITVENNDYSENQDEIVKDVKHEFKVTDKVVPIKIKVWDRDEDGDDLADASSHEGGGKYNDTSDRRGAIFHGKYDILNHSLIDNFEDSEIDVFEKRVNGIESYYFTSGELPPDNSIDEEELDVEVWFKIEDKYLQPEPTIQGPSDVVQRRALVLYGDVENGIAPYTYEWDLNDNGRYDDDEDAEGSMTYNAWPKAGTYKINLRIKDGFDQIDEISKIIEVEENQPPVTCIKGPTKIEKDKFYTWEIYAVDPNGDQVRLWIQTPGEKIWEVDWSENYYDSGEIVEYTASFGGRGPRLPINFNAKAKDIDNLEGEETSLKVTFPKSKVINQRIIFTLKQMMYKNGLLLELLNYFS